MNYYYMLFQIIFCFKALSTKIALHFASLMKWCNVTVQVLLIYKSNITYVALERFLSFMNSPYMFIRISFIWQNPFTIVTLQSLVSKILFWKGILDSWTITTCFFKLSSFVKLLAQKSHYTFLPSRSDVMCLFKSSLLTNPTSHMLHMKGFYPSWTVVICSIKLILSEKILLQ